MAKRRPSGDGMVRKREDGRWEGRIVVGHKQNGEPIFRYVLAKNQKELLDKLHRDLEAFQDVELTEDSRMTLGEWLERWMEDYGAATLRPNTLRSYEQFIRCYIKPYLGDKIDLAPNVQSVGFVYHVPQRDDDTGMGILRGGGIEVFIDRNKADAADAEILLDVIAGVDGVPPQTGEVFHNDAVDVTGLNIREHLLKARTVEVCPGRAVVNVGIVHADLRVLLQIAGNNHLLGFNGYAVRVGILHRKADIDDRERKTVSQERTV